MHLEATTGLFYWSYCKKLDVSQEQLSGILSGYSGISLDKNAMGGLVVGTVAVKHRPEGHGQATLAGPPSVLHNFTPAWRDAVLPYGTR